MAEFIIASVSAQDRFVCYEGGGKMSVTNKPEKAAKFPDAAKAWRILTTQMSKKKRDGWKVISYEPKTSIPYHASDELCTYYSVEDILKIIDTATVFKTYHTSYYNSLKNWVMSMDSIAEVGNVVYGVEIPPEYCSEVLLELMQKLSAEGVVNETAE